MKGSEPEDVHMTESGVRVMVMEAFATYERETGLPRHKENLGNFSTLFTTMNKAIGSLNTLKWVIGIVVGGPGIVFCLIEVLRFARGH